MIDYAVRSSAKAASIPHLENHIQYLSDPNHPDHIGKVEIHPPQLFNLEIPTTAAFIAAVVEAQDAYVRYRIGQMGKRTNRLFDEAIYRTPDDTELTKEDREIVEQAMLSLKPGAPAFFQWHRNVERKCWDLHGLTPAKSLNWPPEVYLSAQFGGGRKHIYAELEELDQEIVDMLNERRPPDKWITSARQRRKEKAKAVVKKTPLAVEIAKSRSEMVNAIDLQPLIEGLGHVVKRVTDRFISVLFAGRKQPRRYAIDTLLDDIKVAQKDLQKPFDDPGMSQK